MAQAGPIRAPEFTPELSRADAGPLTPTAHVISDHPSFQAVPLRRTFSLTPPPPSVGYFFLHQCLMSSC
jgi:hypothetical protein